MAVGKAFRRRNDRKHPAFRVLAKRHLILDGTDRSGREGNTPPPGVPAFFERVVAVTKKR